MRVRLAREGTEVTRQAARAVDATVFRFFRLALASMRPAQWTKNLFVLAPLLFGGKLGDFRAIDAAFFACAAFCLASSALYILNDIFDRPADQLHPTKRRRPIASGRLSVTAASLVCAALLLSAGGMALALGDVFLSLVAVYCGLTLAYCLALKHVILVDALLIATGFVVRVAGGAVAIQVEASHWLIVCAFLLALYLTFAKRRQELILMRGRAVVHRRVLGQYSAGYLDQVNNILLGAAIVCYALYAVAPDTIARFGTGALIYGTVFVVYGLLRYMMLVHSGENGGDPGQLVVSDRPLRTAVFLWAAYNAVIIYRVPLRTFFESLS